jgi:hypothetical protein
MVVARAVAAPTVAVEAVARAAVVRTGAEGVQDRPVAAPVGPVVPVVVEAEAITKIYAWRLMPHEAETG